MSGLAYITADRIGEITGGGRVTQQELQALCEFSEEQTLLRRDPLLSSITAFSRDNLGNALPEPWRWDDTLVARQDFPYFKPRLAHFYSGSFPKTVAMLKDRGCKVVYTIAAHDKEVSRREHEKMGIPFSYTHLTDPKLWKQYIEGYRLADVLVCPSTVAEKTVRAYGPDFAKKDIRVIPHGHNPPKKEEVVSMASTKPLATDLIIGYMGALGADKGVRYLLEAWKRLGYKDGSMLILAGRDSSSPTARWLIEKYGGGNIQLMGWVNNIADFYNKISLYIQPSMTEGFGIEVLEAMSFGRPVLCSKGAGAYDLLKGTAWETWSFTPGDVDELAAKIDAARKEDWCLGSVGLSLHTRAAECTWDKVRKQYKDLWAEVLQ